MWEDLDEAFPELTAKLEAFGAGTDRALFITGHSLGAALSGLSAARLTAEGYNVSGEGTLLERWSGGRTCTPGLHSVPMHSVRMHVDAPGCRCLTLSAG